MTKWTKEYDNDTGPYDDYFEEWWNVTDGNHTYRCNNSDDADFLIAALAQPEQKPVAWMYPEGLEALKAGKPWTAYGTRQEPNNTALYLSPQPDIPPYAWVTFTPYGDEDDVWYENPEGKLLEGWTYKPLYDTTPPQRKPLTDEQLEAMAEKHVTNCYFDTLKYARAIEAAHGIKE